MAISVSDERFQNLNRTGNRFNFQNLINDQRILMYGVECSVGAADRYAAGGVDIDLLRGTAKSVEYVLMGHYEGPGADAYYDYASGHIIIKDAAGAEIANNTAIGNATFSMLVFARE